MADFLAYGVWHGPGYSAGTFNPTGQRIFSTSERFLQGVDGYDNYVAKSHDLNEIVAGEILRDELAAVGITGRDNLPLNDTINNADGSVSYSQPLLNRSLASVFFQEIERVADFNQYINHPDVTTVAQQQAVISAFVNYYEHIMRSNFQYAFDSLSNTLGGLEEGLSAISIRLQLGAAANVFLQENAALDFLLNGGVNSEGQLVPGIRDFSTDPLLDANTQAYLDANFVSPQLSNGPSSFVTPLAGQPYIPTVQAGIILDIDNSRTDLLGLVTDLRDGFNATNPAVAQALQELDAFGYANFSELVVALRVLDIEQFNGPENRQCFPAGVKILLEENTETEIENIDLSSIVMAHDTHGNLVPGRVSQLLENVTTEWIKLSNGTIVTPGHRYLQADGTFEEIGKMLEAGGGECEVVLADGTLQKVTGERIVYSAETAHLYEE